MDGLSRLNALSEDDAREALLRCCGSSRWAKAVSLGRPYRDERQLLQAANATWKELGPSDWLQAFEHHPRIGDREALRAKFARASDVWASQEQSGAAAASEEVLEALEQGNREYEAKFGHIFIVCATGKSAEEMLGLLRQRLPNEPIAELKAAAEEQRKIMELRLLKLIGEPARKGGS